VFAVYSSDFLYRWHGIIALRLPVAATLPGDFSQRRCQNSNKTSTHIYMIYILFWIEMLVCTNCSIAEFLEFLEYATLQPWKRYSRQWLKTSPTLSQFALTIGGIDRGRQLVMRSISSRTRKVVTLSGPS
jgi:hypothetical protein